MTGPARLPRFSPAERAVHRITALLMIVCIATAAILYNGSFAVQVGHRRVIELIHVYCGFALPVPMVLGLGSRAYRGDLGLLNRFSRADWRWLRGRYRAAAQSAVGKFNAGQKLNACLSSGSILVLLGTGVIMYFVTLAPLGWRTGATFVHDWFALAVGLLVIGHIYRAVGDPEARRGMRTGSVAARWAQRQHPRWYRELTGAAGGATPAGDDPGDVGPDGRG